MTGGETGFAACSAALAAPGFGAVVTLASECGVSAIFGALIAECGRERSSCKTVAASFP